MTSPIMSTCVITCFRLAQLVSNTGNCVRVNPTHYSANSDWICYSQMYSSAEKEKLFGRIIFSKSTFATEKFELKYKVMFFFNKILHVVFHTLCILDLFRNLQDWMDITLYLFFFPYSALTLRAVGRSFVPLYPCYLLSSTFLTQSKYPPPPLCT